MSLTLRMRILQKTMPYSPLVERPLPGTFPLEADKWLWVDDAYAEQVAEKARILQDHQDNVLMQDPIASDAAEELRDHVVAHLLKDHVGFAQTDKGILCPDHREVSLEGAPLAVLSRLVQEDFCILQKPEGSDEHILTAGLLAFPASWTLSQKFMKPLTGIHEPVASYDENIAKRVQRLFDGIRVGKPMWRYNSLWYRDAELFQPRREDEQRSSEGLDGPYMRSERQTLLRLPLSGAVVFGIHTFLLNAADVPSADE